MVAVSIWDDLLSSREIAPLPLSTDASNVWQSCKVGLDPEVRKVLLEALEDAPSWYDAYSRLRDLVPEGEEPIPRVDLGPQD